MSQFDPSNRTPWVSIVIPVYQGEAHLQIAAESVLVQSFTDYELILIDDGSTDGTGAICDALRTRDARVSVYHLPKNTGLSYARNAGLAHCRGEYVLFLDADDRIESELLANIHSSLKAHPAEWVIWGVTEAHYNRRGALVRRKEITPDFLYASDQQAVREAVMPLETLTLFGYAWNKLYKLESIRSRGVQIEDVELIEDVLFNIAFARDAMSLLVLPLPASHYTRRRRDNLTARKLDRYFELNARRVEELYELHIAWKMDTLSIRRQLVPIYVRYFLSVLERNCRPEREMSHADRAAWTRAACDTQIFADLMPCLRARTNLAGIAGRIIRKRITPLCLLMGRALYWSNRYARPVYEALLRAR